MLVNVHPCAHAHIQDRPFLEVGILAVVQPRACSREFASSGNWSVLIELLVHCPGFVINARVIPLFVWDLGQVEF